MDNPAAGDPVNVWDRGWARSRMWAQYADNHRGVCLVFDRDETIRDIVAQLDAEGDAANGSVTYEDSAAPDAFVVDANRVDPTYPLTAVINQMWAYRDQLFFRKARDWETEYEYRFLLRREDPAPFCASVSPDRAGAGVM